MTTKVSSGGKKQGQKYQNTTGFRHNKSSKKTIKILSYPIENLCARCYDIIEWRKKYRKYKPMTQPKKCVTCMMKTITESYHVMCNSCALSKGVCTKCCQSNPIVVDGKNNSTPIQLNAQHQEFESKLRSMNERQRRTFLRHLEQGKVTECEISDWISSNCGISQGDELMSCSEDEVDSD